MIGISKTHYFGTEDLNQPKFERFFQSFPTKCGKRLPRESVTNSKEEVTCQRCLKSIKIQEAVEKNKRVRRMFMEGQVIGCIAISDVDKVLGNNLCINCLLKREYACTLLEKDRKNIFPIIKRRKTTKVVLYD